MCFEVLILSVALTRKKRGLLGSSDLEMRVEWLMRFLESEGYSKRVSLS